MYQEGGHTAGLSCMIQKKDGDLLEWIHRMGYKGTLEDVRLVSRGRKER